MHAASFEHLDFAHIGLTFISMPLLLLFTFLAEHYVIAKLFKQFDRMREYIFLLALAWCLSISVLAKIIGLTYEIGAFLAGVSIAEGPIALYIAESFKPLRDFFLILFFFSIGAAFDWHYIDDVAIPAIWLAGILLLLKPVVFSTLLRGVHENATMAWEIGWRLGQISEFSLLIGYIAMTSHLIGVKALYLIQATTILTFMASSYIVVLRYPTPVAVSERLRRD